MKAFRHIAATAAASALIVGSALAAPTPQAGAFSCRKWTQLYLRMESCYIACQVTV